MEQEFIYESKNDEWKLSFYFVSSFQKKNYIF